MTESNPPQVHMPKVVLGAVCLAFHRAAIRYWFRRHGQVFEIDVPFFGRSVVVSDPALVRSVWTAGPEQLINAQPNLSNLFGPGSIFGLEGAQHRHRRQLLAPALHGQALTHHAKVIADETRRESANWPEGTEFRILEPMERITFNVILRTLFGADVDPATLDEVRQIIPPYKKLGQLLAFVPVPAFPTGRYSPWNKLDEYHKAFDRIVFALIARAEADPGLRDRADILAVLVRNGVPHQDICDELLALIGAGHETTAAALAWMFERLRRHPDVLTGLVRELDLGGGNLRRATILELLRARTIIDVAGRRVNAPSFSLGAWSVPHGRTVLVRIADLHENPDIFVQPEQFDPYRFHGASPPTSAWLPFGGGTRRCPGADFAITEMDVVLRTVLQDFQIQTDATAGEKPHFRGVAHTPKLGGRVVMYRRT